MKVLDGYHNFDIKNYPTNLLYLSNTDLTLIGQNVGI